MSAAPNAPSVRLTAAAAAVDGWPEAYAAPLADLLRQEAAHAADLERVSPGWDRYPSGALLLRLADAVISEESS